MLRLALAALLAALVVAPLALAQGGVERVDSIIERLEKRLLDSESDGLTYGEKLPPPSVDDPPAAQYQFKAKDPVKVQASNPAQKDLKQAATAVAALEADIDQLASAVQKTKQSIIDEAGIDNFVAIEAQLENDEKMAIKSLTVKLDGYPLYEVSDAAGLWLPSKLLPLYAGPLTPGNHRIDFEARLVLRENKGLPVNGDVYRFVSRVFDVGVPGGSVNTRYLITVAPPGKDGAAPEATMKEVN